MASHGLDEEDSDDGRSCLLSESINAALPEIGISLAEFIDPTGV